MFTVLFLLLLAPSVGPLNDLMEVYATPVRSRGFRMTCDMRSDTCSDGRRITTVRATPVPCETSPGVWEMVPEDTGCYSVRGLESWAANTSYVSYGAELDRAGWGMENGSTIERLPGGGYRLTRGPGSSGISDGQFTPDDGTTYTLAAILRAGTAHNVQLVLNNGNVTAPPNCTVAPVSEWTTYSCTATGAQIAEGGRSGRRKIYL